MYFSTKFRRLFPKFFKLFQIHENGEERKLDDEEKPLLVQLMWHRDDREGRFLLRRDRMPVIPLTV